MSEQATGWSEAETAEILAIQEQTGCDRKVAISKMQAAKKLAAKSAKKDEDKPSSSMAIPAKITASIAALTSDKLHSELLSTYVTLGENAIMYHALILDARRRMNNGEKVGGYLTWTEYADFYCKKQDETLPTCLRRLRRALEGVNPDKKHRNKVGRKSARQVLTASLDENERLTKAAAKKEFDRGYGEGNSAAGKLFDKKLATVNQALVAVNQKLVEVKAKKSKSIVTAVVPTSPTVTNVVAYFLTALARTAADNPVAFLDEVISKLTDEQHKAIAATAGL